MNLENIEKFCKDRSEFSYKTFGTKEERGPQGPLEHLLQEVNEVIAEPTDRMEYADCFLLLVDAYNRAGLGDLLELIKDANDKLEINKNRKLKKNGLVFNHIKNVK